MGLVLAEVAAVESENVLLNYSSPDSVKLLRLSSETFDRLLFPDLSETSERQKIHLMTGAAVGTCRSTSREFTGGTNETCGCESWLKVLFTSSEQLENFLL